MKLPLFTASLRKFLLAVYIFLFVFLFNPVLTVSSILLPELDISAGSWALCAQEIIPGEESDTSETVTAVKKEWFIYYKTSKKIIAGPFDEVSDAIRAWLDNPKIEPKKKYYIGRNGVLYTDNPESYYTRQYSAIIAERDALKEAENQENTEQLSPKELKALEKAEKKAQKKAEKEAARRKRKGIPDDPPGVKTVLSEPEEKAEDVSDQIVTGEENKTVSEIPETEITAETENDTAPEKEETIEPEPDYTPWTPEPDLFSGSNRYQKKYLSDYVKNDSFGIPDGSEEKKEMDFASEYADEIFQTDSKGTTALMAAVKDSNDWKVKNLISAGAPVNAIDNDGWTALMYAVRYQSNLSIMNLLLDAGADVKIQNNFSLSAMVIAACYNNNPDILKKLLSYYSPSDKEIQRAFVQLISSQTNDTFAQVSKAQVFLDFGLPVNSYFEGKTPLMYACKYCKSTKVIKLLMDKDAGLKLRSTEGKTAFDYAQENKSLPKDEVYWALNKR